MKADSFSLIGKTALVTGSSSGIGLETALLLARRGASVVLHGGHSPEKLATAVATFSSEGYQANSIHANLSSPHERARLVKEAWSQHQAIDILVNCAGADVLTGDIARLSFAEKLALLWEVDVQATTEICRELGGKMKERKSGVIINIGWDQAALGMAGDSGELFATVKGAVTAYSLSLAKSLAPEVRVNVVAPGWIKTAWGKTASAVWQTRAAEESLLKRWGTPADVAEAIAFLVSPAAQFITGQILPVNGGFAGAYFG